MGERRKRKSLWTEEAETKPFTGNHSWIGKDKHPSHDGEQNHEFPASGSHGLPKSRYHSGHPSMESIHEDPVDWINGRENAYQDMEICGENNYYQDMSPEFKYNHLLEDDQSHSRRYISICSKEEVGIEAGVEEMSNEADFAPGRGRRDDFSKYFLPKNTNHRDGGLGGRDTSESRRSREDHGNDSKQSYSRGARIESDASDPYHGENEQFLNNSHRAETLLRVVVGGETIADFLTILLLMKPVFKVRKCDRDRDNCKFFHEDPNFNRLEGRLGKVNNDHNSRDNDRSSHDKVNKRDGLRWESCNEAAGISNHMKPSGRDIVIESTVDKSNAGQNNRMSQSLGNEKVNRGLPQHTNNLVPVHRAGNGSYGGDAGTTESAVEENMMAKQDVLEFHGSQLQNQDGNTIKLQVDQRFPLNAGQQNVSPVSHIQHQNHGVVEKNVVNSFHSDVINEVKDSRNGTVGDFISAQNLHQNGKSVLLESSSISKEAGSKDMPALNGAEIHHAANLNLSQIQKLQDAIQMAGVSDTNAMLSFPNSVISEQSAQCTNTLLSTSLQQVAPAEDMQLNRVTVSHDPISSAENGRNSNEHEEGTKMPSTDNTETEHSGRSTEQQEMSHKNAECDEVKGGMGEQTKGVQLSKQSETLDDHGKADESIGNKDDKGTRLFKNSLIEFVKDKLKEGRMSRDVLL
ncbi:hypothetical protein SASPL_131288 [Salvia splendens]|uniref:Uncharacterized protein n=1 Tax=Salvia splendens TaxID=180675 RepID=A0A8X8ZKV3_SALSN|nr:hypothetical protein SASPL_131288 [Salvia splendens]